MAENLWTVIAQIFFSSYLSLLLTIYGQVPSNYRRLYQLAKKGSASGFVDHDNRVESHAIGQYVILSLIGLWAAYFATSDFSGLPPSLGLLLLSIAPIIIIAHLGLLGQACWWLSRADLAGNPTDAKIRLRKINMSGAVLFHVYIAATLVATVIMKDGQSTIAVFFEILAAIAVSTILLIIFYGILENRLQNV
jgi:hypothetical protein